MSARQIARVRKICLALAGSSEKLSHGEPTFFVSGRVFTMFADDHHGDGRVAVWLPDPMGARDALVESNPETYFVPPYVGVKGWMGIELRTIDDSRLQFLIEVAWESLAKGKLRTADADVRPRSAAKKRRTAAKPPRAPSRARGARPRPS